MKEVDQKKMTVGKKRKEKSSIDKEREDDEMKKELIGSLSLDDVPSAGRQGKKGGSFFIHFLMISGRRILR